MTLYCWTAPLRAAGGPDSRYPGRPLLPSAMKYTVWSRSVSSRCTSWVVSAASTARSSDRWNAIALCAAPAMRTPPSTRAVTVGMAMSSNSRERTRQFFKPALPGPRPPRPPPWPFGPPPGGLVWPPASPGPGPVTPGTEPFAPGMVPFVSGPVPLTPGSVPGPGIAIPGPVMDPAGGAGVRAPGTPPPRARGPWLALFRDVPALRPLTRPMTRAWQLVGSRFGAVGYLDHGGSGARGRGRAALCRLAARALPADGPDGARPLLPDGGRRGSRAAQRPGQRRRGRLRRFLL